MDDFKALKGNRIFFFVTFKPLKITTYVPFSAFLDFVLLVQLKLSSTKTKGGTKPHVGGI